MRTDDTSGTSAENVSIFQAIFQALPLPTFCWNKRAVDFELLNFNIAARSYLGNLDTDYKGVLASDFYGNQALLLQGLKSCHQKQTSFRLNTIVSATTHNNTHRLNVHFIYVDVETVLVQLEEITAANQVEHYTLPNNTISNDAADLYEHELQLMQINAHVIHQNKALSEANSAIEASEFRLLEAQRAAKVGNWQTDLATLKVIWSAETYRIFELDEAHFEPTHQSFLSFVHPDDKALVDEAFVSSFSSKVYNAIEHRILTSKGNLKYVEERWKISFNELGEATQVFGTCQDISDRKIIEIELAKAKLQVEEKEQRLQLAVEAAKLGVWEWNMEDNTVFWSDRMFEMHGIKRGAELNFFEARSKSIHPDDSERILVEVQKSLVADHPFEMTFRTVKENGAIAFIRAESLVLKNKEGKAYRMIGINRDITESKRYEEQLALSALILNSSHDAIMSISFDNSITSWNSGAEDIFGYNAQEIIGKSVLILIPPDLHHEISFFTEIIGRKERIDNHETLRIRKDGTIIHVSLTISPIIDEFGQVLAASEIIRDISAQKTTEREKAKIMNDLVQRNRDLEQYSYIVSHNLRAPVANIMAINDILFDPDMEADERETLFKALSKSVEAMDSVLKDLTHILYVRREVNEHKTNIHFSELFEEVTTAIAHIVSSEKVKFMVDFKAVDQMMTNKSYMYSIFYNLISNSIKYKNPACTPVIHISSAITANKITLIFRDNGLGIDTAKYGEQIFGLYKRFHTHVPGKGMGLFMVKTQVEALDGKISFTSHLNQGSEFRIEFGE